MSVESRKRRKACSVASRKSAMRLRDDPADGDASTMADILSRLRLEIVWGLAALREIRYCLSMREGSDNE